MTGTTTTARARRRAGFTLIELIVAMAILATLAALTAAGVQRARTAQQHATTNQTLTKLQTGLEQQRAAVLDEARDDKNPYLPLVIQFCDGDKDRAKALLAYAYMRWYFPDTFAEARSSITLGSLTLAPRGEFATIPATTLSNGQEGAVLLKIILDRAVRGMKFAGDDVTARAQGTVTAGSTAFPVYTDAWVNPITYHRWAIYGELQSPPYVSANAAFKDSLDPLGRLAGSWTNKSTAQTALGVTFDGTTNRVPTVIALGPDGRFDDNPAANTDDFFGYRLRQAGNRGD